MNGFLLLANTFIYYWLHLQLNFLDFGAEGFQESVQKT